MCLKCAAYEDLQIAVAEVATGRIVYEGLDADAAAALLEPGTVFSRERGARFARLVALRAAATARRIQEE